MNVTKLYNEFIHLMIHISPLILLETIFYFSYITKIEQNAFISSLDQSIPYAIEKLNLPENIIIQIQTYLNSTNIIPGLYTEMEESFYARDKNNESLQLRMFYSLHIIFNLFIGIVFILPFFANRTKMLMEYPWLKKMAFSAFVIIVMFLFEYFFFVMVIQHYIITTNAEMVYYIAYKLVTL